MKDASVRVCEGPVEVLLGGVEAGHDRDEPHQQSHRPAAAHQVGRPGLRVLRLVQISISQLQSSLTLYLRGLLTMAMYRS